MVEGNTDDHVRALADALAVSPQLIRQWTERDETFREMCEEHGSCEDMLKRWRAELPRQLSRIAESERLAGELEQEIARFLQDRSQADRGP